MTFRKIFPETNAYAQERALRDTLLRQPLGLTMDAESVDWADGTRHFGLFDETDTLVACVLASPGPNGSVRLRQMAVSSASQSSGFGRSLMQQAEAELRRSGVKSLSLHARDTAIGFYEKLGYSRVGDIYLELGIPHQLMGKELVRKE
ncbi:GNAT family N-acetyltransferase [Spartobacteria bacterium LR76]|nr:GNAT family N-acetyltransferase [Spartobacteria bacterium LR76]